MAYNGNIIKLMKYQIKLNFFLMMLKVLIY